ncbi:MAG: hypothetical protein AB7L66_10480 [Gemmatimonadales bacterium]
MSRLPTDSSQLDRFVTLSVTLTGFDAAELWGTGLVETYYGLLPSIVGDGMYGRFMTRWYYTWQRGEGNEQLLDELVTEQILEDPDFGPLARNLVYLWYTGQWNQLPADWRNRNGAWANDATFIVSSAAYTEGLVWKAMGTHPPAARQPGFGSWALPPRTDQA